ncbi:uncharacterized protein LOC116181896 [Photinus pyralis]|uniref:uncharacterized protein LOC116169209 n=1 Tax=Photinus pyralis TaxID=7054 RepID=UPI0012673AE3|nr:uncharacterized protein LOC116169209 [Photinus pyralis]XP_031358232.1 uncharacterized protein LOC116181896 [Photinus pyralis]
MNLQSVDEYNLELIDPQTNKHYNVIVNHDDYVRAQNDEKFLGSLLFHAKTNANCEYVTTQRTEENQFDEGNVSKGGNVWSYQATVDLIHAMNVHKDDLNHPLKRKHVYEHICNDMLSSGHNITEVMARNKWKSLCRSYSKAKDNRNRTGQAPARFLFFDLMDDVLGDKPTNNCQHSINSNNAPLTDLTNSESTEQPIVAETDEHVASESEKKTKASAKTSLVEYIKLKREECKAKKQRHEERLKMQQEIIDFHENEPPLFVIGFINLYMFFWLHILYLVRNKSFILLHITLGYLYTFHKRFVVAEKYWSVLR